MIILFYLILLKALIVFTPYAVVNKSTMSNLDSVYISKRIENSVWSHKVAENCVYNIFYFKLNKKFVYQSCELDDIFYGTFKINNDSVVLDQKISRRDSLLLPSSPHRSERTIYKFTIKNKKYLKLISWQSMNPKGEWWKPVILNQEILYERIK